MRLVSVGECMVELSADPDAQGRLRQGFAGDTLNTAWYARACLPAQDAVDYVTAIGTDPLSQAMLDFISGAGIGTDWIRRDPQRAPGLYLISLTEGERSFTYWRENSAARRLADDPAHLVTALCGADLAYFSGITLAILPPEGREAFLAALADTRRVAFDPNLRPRLWQSLTEMREWTLRGAAAAQVILPSFDDEAAAFGDADPAATAARYVAAGATEVVVKNGGSPMAAWCDGAPVPLPPVNRLQPRDSTGAGDAFNGAYLASRMHGASLPDAVAQGHAMAARVIDHPGALMPMECISANTAGRVEPIRGNV
ncbi:sugar kinase [Paracoccus suum]|uniref:Sugar kinase n=1 Tax=Paracoccus suum TaxID=2259340 RepID=A0A344PML6_9RHOB|nr:sugar kinase [Paracoccus suum]AXC50621.1 sugar kinase [Paracoccus suum]